MESVARGTSDTRHRFFGFVWNSGILAASAATGGVLIGLPLAYLASRRPTMSEPRLSASRLCRLCAPRTGGRTGCPRPLHQIGPVFYGSVLILIVAYVIHFLPAGLQSLEPALQQMYAESGRSRANSWLGMRETWRRVTLPLVRNGFVVAWVLMFLQTMKELPATLLLRPVGFDTLAIRVWMEASEEYYQLAAPAALLIVLLSLPALALLVSKDWRAA